MKQLTDIQKERLEGTQVPGSGDSHCRCDGSGTDLVQCHAHHHYRKQVPFTWGYGYHHSVKNHRVLQRKEELVLHSKWLVGISEQPLGFIFILQATLFLKKSKLLFAHIHFLLYLCRKKENNICILTN